MKPLTYVHQGITVEDMDASVLWYENVFGAKVVRDEYNEPLQCRIVFLEAGNALFELFKCFAADARPTPPERRESMQDLHTGGTKHVCYDLDLPEFFRDKVDVYGVDVDFGPVREGDNWMGFIRDPSGVLIEVYDTGGYLRDPHAFDARKPVMKA